MADADAATQETAAPDRMKAAYYERYGPPEVVEIREVDPPIPSDDEVLVRVGGSGLGGVDYNIDGVSNNAYGGRTAFIPPAG